ncbi:MAG: hypothetical protein MZV63_10190 [Marinilabiliales bacterium]|nr:hypothetical protein [Marinilabiliales bacterium]
MYIQPEMMLQFQYRTSIHKQQGCRTGLIIQSGLLPAAPIYPCSRFYGPNGFIVTIDHVVMANANYSFTYKTTINNKLKVVVFIMVIILAQCLGMALCIWRAKYFLLEDLALFLDCSGNGTIEYGGTGTYNINATLYSSIPRIPYFGTGSRIHLTKT